MNNHQYSLPSIGPTRKIKKIPLKKMKHMIDQAYAKEAKETKKINVGNDGSISFMTNFKYLDSWISYDLYDSYDIFSRIKKFRKAMGVLKFFWNSMEVDIECKYLIYNAIPFNLLLWG